MKTARPLILLGLFSVLPAASAADGAAAAVDTSKWLCKLCKFEEGASGSLEVGVESVSEKSARFGDFNGRDDKGAYFIGEAASRYRGADGTFWNVRASNIGLDSRSAALEAGRQGTYRLFLESESTPRFYTDTARTPFLGSGSTVQGLPAGYPAATTGLMPLAATLQEAELQSKRTRINLGASWTTPSSWQFDLGYRRDARFGTKRTAGALFINAAQLVEPLDTVTDRIDASASYFGTRLQARFAYQGSRFRNDANSLTWVNPFTPILGGTIGQLALPPDNQFHQLSAAVAYAFTERTRGSADIAIGRMTQDEGYLAPTLNTGLVVPALPSGSLNGRVATVNASLKLTSAVTDQLRLNAAYTHDDRDNNTPQALYAWVTTDTFLAAPRTNLPYGFTQDRLKLSADYAYSARIKASAGLDHDWHKRTFQEVDTTRESTLWGKVRARALDNLDLIVKAAYGERRNSGYQILATTVPPENPLLRKYNMANRARESVGVRADFAATDKLSLGLGFDASRDRYEDSSIGLTDGRDTSFNGDVAYLLSEQTSVHLFANHQTIRSKQAGSQAFATPDWFAENNDTVKLVGVGFKHAAIKNKLDLGADYTWTRTQSAIRVDAGVADPAFPNLSTALDSLRLYAAYRLKDNVTLNAGYWYERYRSANWALDGVAPGTIPNVLAFGEQAPQYRVHVLRASVRYGF